MIVINRIGLQGDVVRSKALEALDGAEQGGDRDMRQNHTPRIPLRRGCSFLLPHAAAPRSDCTKIEHRLAGLKTCRDGATGCDSGARVFLSTCACAAHVVVWPWVPTPRLPVA